MSSAFGARRGSLLAAVGVATMLLAACGGSASSDNAKVATLQDAGASGASAATTTTVADTKTTQEAWLAMAKCMRDNGVDMADPTFDADGNVQGGFGPGAGIDFRSENVRTALDACQQYLQAVRPQGAGPGGNGANREQIQTALSAFTSCLRDNGVQVDDIQFGAGPGGQGGPGQGGAGGQAPGAPGGAANGSVPTPPPGGFDGSAPQRPANGQGFDPTARIVERLGLDSTDPAVAAALEACQPALQAAFTPGSTTTTAKP